MQRRLAGGLPLAVRDRSVHYRIRELAGFSARRCCTSCQRCGTGRKLKPGIPVLAFPLEIFQNSAPSDSDCTCSQDRSGPQIRPARIVAVAHGTTFSKDLGAAGYGVGSRAQRIGPRVGGRWRGPVASGLTTLRGRDTECEDEEDDGHAQAGTARHRRPPTGNS